MGNSIPNIEKHKPGNTLRDIILGGQDGLVNVLGVVLGVSAVSTERSIILATSLAATFAESISMAAVAYTSFLTERDRYQKELKNELAEIKAFPKVEKQEIRDIYIKKGFHGKLLNQVVSTITSNKKVWLAEMMSEELHLAPLNTKSVLRIAATVGGTSFLGSLIPFSPFVFLPHNQALIAAILISGLALFIVGVYQAKTLVGDWKKSGVQMVVIGLGAALFGFFVAHLFS